MLPSFFVETEIMKITTILGMVIILMGALPNLSSAQEEKKHFFFNNHPKIRRTMKAAGIGVMTGGMAAPLLGHSVATGAVLGAGKGAAVQTYKDKKKTKAKKHHFF